MQHAGGSVLPSSVSRALIILADLTEYYKLGGAPGHDLSYMIERGDVCSELVNARRAQLRLYLTQPQGQNQGVETGSLANLIHKSYTSLGNGGSSSSMSAMNAS